MQACLSSECHVDGFLVVRLLIVVVTTVRRDVPGDLGQRFHLHQPLGRDQLLRELDRDVVRYQLGVDVAPRDTANGAFFFVPSVLSVLSIYDSDRLDFDFLLRLLQGDHHGILLGADTHPLKRRRHDVEGDTLLVAIRHVLGCTSLADQAGDMVALRDPFLPRGEVDIRVKRSHDETVLAERRLGRVCVSVAEGHMCIQKGRVTHVYPEDARVMEGGYTCDTTFAGSVKPKNHDTHDLLLERR